MDFVAFFLFPILAVVTLSRLLSPKSQGRRLRIAAVTFGIPFLIFFLDEILGQSYLHVLCAIDGGLHSKGRVSAEGYFNPNDSGCDSECLSALLKRKFKYYEVDAVKGYSFNTNKSRVHKYYLADSQECPAEGFRVSPYGRKLMTDFMPHGKCIAVTTLEQPESRYEVSGVHNLPVWPFRKTPPTGSWPFKRFSYLKDRKSGELVASYTSFWWWGGWLRHYSFGHNSATVCPAIGSQNSDVRDIMVPSGEGSGVVTR